MGVEAAVYGAGCYAGAMTRVAALCLLGIGTTAVAYAQPAEPRPSTDDGSETPPATEPSEVEESADAIPPPPGSSNPSEGNEPSGPAGEGSSGTDAPPVEGANSPDDTRLQVIVVDVAAYGVDPVVAQHVTAQMRTSAAEMGYRVLSPERTIEAAQRAGMHYPPAPADLWRVTYASQSHRGAFAKVWAHDGQYVTEITVASLDGTGPFFSRGTSGADDLHAVVDQLTREALPAPDTWDASEAERLQARQTQPQPAATPGSPVVTMPRTPVVRRAPPEDRRPTRRWDLALQTEGAIGTTSDGFYNHLVGLRLGFRITKMIHMGLYLAYTNLRGKDGRVGNMVGYLQIEDRIRITRRSDITVPLRFGAGYLPFNGAFIRFSAGVNIPLTQRVELGFDILTPTFWVLPERTAVSLNLAAELIFRL